MTSYVLARPLRLDLDAFARAAGLHPDVIRRFVALGLIDGSRDASGMLWFSPSQLAAVGRLQRLRAGFGLNYASLGLVVELLDRIAQLEAAQRQRPLESASPRGARRWT
jgi:chaperone modulatory protein CbpM